jgi:predicted permease
MPLSWIRNLARNLRHRDRLEQDVERELQSYVDLVADEYRAGGHGDEASARAARLAIGGAQQVKEQVLAARAGAWLDTLWRDVTFGTRLLRRTPSFAATAILSLALGIGANSAVFGLVNAIRLRNLPVARAQELADVRLDGPRCCRHTGRNRQVSLPLWDEISRQQQAFSELFAFADTRVNLAAQGEVRYVEALYVSGSFFQVLDVAAARGRTLLPADDRQGCANAGAVISHALWQSEFGGRSDILSQTLRSQHPIVGVLPASFFGVEVGRRADVVLPLCASGFNRRDHWWLAVMGRLKPGWTAEQATAHFATLGPALLRNSVPPSYNAEQARQFETLRFSVHAAGNGVSPLRAAYAEPLWLLLAIAGLVLVTACANVASLSLVRTTARTTELALRLALGASRLRLIRQFVVEGLLIALAGTAAGIAVARAAHEAILALLSTPTDPIVLDANLDWRIIGFTAAVVGLTTLAFALAPAILVRRGTALTAGDPRTTQSAHRVAAREVLVSVQVAMSVVLVASAMVFIMTSRNLLRTDAGFNPANVLVANVFLSESAHPPAGRAAARTDLLRRMAAIPGVTAASYSSTPPLSGSSWDSVVGIAGPAGERRVETNRNEVSDDYFRAMEIGLVAGRTFSTADVPTAPLVALVNETFARRFLDGAPAVGRRVSEGMQVFEIVGVIRDTKQYTLREEFRPIVYTAALQAPQASLTVRFVLRTSAGTGPTAEAVRQTLAEFSPTAGVRFATLDDLVANATQRERLMARLAGFFGIIALTLAAVGVYGVVAFSAASRRREIGIRIALGAGAAHVATTVVGRIAVVAGSGLVAGLALALAAQSLAASFLYRVQLEDPRVLASILAVIVGAGVLAAVMPVRRALHTDPVQALRLY